MENRYHFLKSIVENQQGLAVFSLDKQYCYTFFTASHAQYMELVHQAKINLGENILHKIESPLNRTQAKGYFDRALQGDSFTATESYGNREDNQNYYEAHYLPVTNEAKEIIGLNAFFIDITSSKLAEKEIEEAIRERERFIESITDSSPDRIYVYDIEKKKLIYANRHLGESLGYSPEEVQEMGEDYLPSLVHDDDYMKMPILSTQWENKSDHDVLETEYRLKSKSGEWRWFMARDTVFRRDQAGKVVQFVGTARDLTESKRSALELKQSEERFKRLQQASYGGIFIHDQGKILDANQGLAEITGYSIGELLGMDGLQLIAPEYREHVTQKVRLNFEAPYDVIGLKKDGGRYHLEVQGKLIPFKDLMVRVTEFREITERKKIEEAIREQNVRLEDIARNLINKNEQLEEFTQIVSHNLRAPVGNIVTLLSLYELDSPLEERQEYIQHLRNSSNLLLGTLNELNEVLKIKQSQHIEKQELEFRIVFDKVCQMLSARIAELGPELHADFEEAPVILYPNIYLESILLNLLSNALKYHSADRKTVIKIKTYLRGQQVMLEVTDNGLGINLKKYAHQIFKMRKTFHEHPESRGLGLFLIKNQIESMGGEIVVKSEVNKGTTFLVKLTV